MSHTLRAVMLIYTTVVALVYGFGAAYFYHQAEYSTAAVSLGFSTLSLSAWVSYLPRNKS